MFESIRQFFTQSTLTSLGKVDLIVVFIAIEDVFEIDCLIGHIESYGDDCNQVMQLRRLKLS